MEHVVFHPGPDGAPAFRRFGSLEDAVRFVEHLRNVEGVSEVSVHALTPVPVAFRAYYKVEVPVSELPAEPEAASADLGQLPMQAVAADPAVPAAPADGEVVVDGGMGNGAGLTEVPELVE